MAIEVTTAYENPTPAENEAYTKMVRKLVSVACERGMPGIGVMPLLAAAKHILDTRPDGIRNVPASMGPSVHRLARLFTDLAVEIDRAIAVIREFEDEAGTPLGASA